MINFGRIRFYTLGIFVRQRMFGNIDNKGGYMNNFCIKKMGNTPNYSTKKLHKKPNRLLLLMLAFLGLSGCDNPFERPLAGDVAAPSFSSKEEYVLFVDTTLSNNQNIDFKHDISLSLTNGDNIIRFVADGYNTTKKIAYECLDFSNEMIEPTDESLDTNEVAMIISNRFGNTYIIVFPNNMEYHIESKLEDFEKQYTNELNLRKKSK